MADDMNGNHDNDDVFVAHADEFDDNLDAQLPAWPKVVGIISIVWGSIGLICNGIGAASAVFMPTLMQSAADTMEGGFPPSITDPPMSTMIASVLGFLLSVFLVIAGAMTVMRKAGGRTAHLIYAPIHIILIIWGIVVQIGVQSETAEWVRQNPDADFSQTQQVGGSVGLIMLGLFSIIFLIWPVFNLVWFGAMKKTHADMTGGVDLDSI